jgi:cytoskeleton protein RodZ
MTPQEFGELIRAHREAKGLSVEELALRFKLSVSTVRGMEEGTLDRMPHAVYAQGFVRAYAQAVGVAPEDLQAGLAVLFSETMVTNVPTVPGPVGRKTPGPGKRGRAVPIVIALLVLVPLCLAGWYAFSHFGALKEVVARPFAAFSPESASSPAGRPSNARHEPAAPATEISAPAMPASSASETSAQTVPGPEPQVQDPPRAPERTGEHPAPPQSVAAQEAVREAQPAPPAVAEASAADASLVEGKQVAVAAIEECWIQVSVDGSISRTFTVYPGETSVVPYKSRLTMVLGNAGGVTLTHNGKPYSTNGRRNEKKTLTFQ